MKVDYRGPKDEKWRHGEEDLREARRLLAEGDERARKIVLQRRMLMSDEEKFERDLAFSLGAWTKAAEAEGRLLMKQVEKLAARAKRDLRDLLGLK